MATKKKTDLTYAEGARELETILSEIESGDTDIDVLSEKVERAADLIKLCREKLTKTELRVSKVVEGLAAEQEGEAEE
jgi:exodeoxyribonuclease VII small subunit